MDNEFIGSSFDSFLEEERLKEKNLSSTDYVPNFEFLDEEERELEHLDASKALPEAERLAALAAFRKAYRDQKKA